ncbi:peptidylprolyl isomerase [Paenibacillus roseipurpureus]|uniref:peptidylprolyl isomerase n=1 Tax=Paenibacillus roseopurpureus TaxID=2918901 RepID=A0AA96LU35_9BACL|nr:peptidylprolyl isomerase [Paenibacillus sp. MBLB1832]WNR46078.1 peptidylprolyl isomerase [Paenibacillus sp. MBLB1832]
MLRLRWPKVRGILFVILLVSYVGVLHTRTSAEVKDETVAWVNGYAVSVEEFEPWVTQQRSLTADYFVRSYQADPGSAEFWLHDYNGEIPLHVAQDNAWKGFFINRILLELSKKNGLIGNTNYSSFVKAWSQENERRKEALSLGKPVYGPEELSFHEYYGYVMDQLALRLQERLSVEWSATDEELRAYFQQTLPLYQSPPDRQVKHAAFTFDVDDAEGKNSRAAAMERATKLKQAWENGDTSLDETSELLQLKGDMLRSYSEEDPLLTGQALRLEEGQVSAVFEEHAALHVIRVESVANTPQPAYEEHKDQVKRAWTREKYKNYISALAQEARIKRDEAVFRSVGSK